MKSFLSFNNIDQQINEVLSKDATAGDWISDFIKSDNPKFAGKSAAKRKEMALAAYYAKQRNEAVVQPNGTDKIQPDEGMGLCQVCGSVDCKEHAYTSPAVTGYVKESLTEEHTVHVDDGSKYGEEPHPKDAEHVMAGVKKHGGKFSGHSDKGAYFKFGSKTDAKNFVDHVKKSPHRSVSADLHESRGHKILATAMANAERMKTVQIPTPAERKAELEKRNKEKEMKESAPVAASLNRHTVVVHVSDPDSPEEGKQRKALSVLAPHSKSAEAAARKHFEKKGWKVHATSIKEEVVVEAKDTVEKDASGKIKSWSHEGDWEKMSTKKQGTGKAANLAGKALQKTKELNKEEVDEAIRVKDTYGTNPTDKDNSSHSKPLRKAAANIVKDYRKTKGRDYKNLERDTGFTVKKEEVDLEESWEVYDTKTRAIHSTHPTQRKAQNAMNKLNDKHPGYETPGNLIASKFGARVSGLKEESIDEAKEMTHAQVLAKIKTGSHEAVTDIKPGKHVELRNNSTGKSTHVYVKEDIESIDELDKKTLGSYVSKSHGQLMKHTASVNMKYGRGDKDATAYALDKDALRKTANRTKGIDQALNKLTKEETTMVTYKEFMASIEEGRIDDLKDKLAADREKRLNKMDYSKEKEAAKNPVTKVKGHSYGAGDEEGEAETTKPAEPAEKRGRGRPAGSKSGARA